MRKLLIAVVALAVLLAAADRIAAAVAENQISDRVAAAYGLAAKPSVTIEGFPFLTQVLSGHYGRIDVSAGQVAAGGATLHHLMAHFTGVHASLSQVLRHGTGTVTADRATGSAVVAFTDVSQRLPQGLRLHPAGKDLKVSGGLRYQGLRIPVSATVSLAVTPSGIKVTPVTVQIPGGPGLPAAAYSSRLHLLVPLSSLPLHLQLSSVRVAADGLRIGAFARDVHFAQPVTAQRVAGQAGIGINEPRD